VRQYACPRCFVVVPGLLEVDQVEGIRDLGRSWMCSECADELLAAAMIDPRFIAAIVGQRGAPASLRQHLRAVGE